MAQPGNVGPASRGRDYDMSCGYEGGQIRAHHVLAVANAGCGLSTYDYSHGWTRWSEIEKSVGLLARHKTVAYFALITWMDWKTGTREEQLGT